MKSLKSIIFVLSFTLLKLNGAPDTYVYRQELEQLKSSPDYEMIFSKKMNYTLGTIQCDIENYKQLSKLNHSQSLFEFLQGKNSIIISAETMPKLYAYIDSLCKAHNIPIPLICLTRDVISPSSVNAAATKLFSYSQIALEQQLLLETCDDELEAVIAHEIGHIKNNHTNKRLCLYAIATFGCFYAIPTILKKYNFSWKKTFPAIATVACLSNVPFIRNFLAKLKKLSPKIITNLFINKCFEKQADAFACSAGKRDGLIKFFEQCQKDEITSLEKTYTVLQKNKNELDNSSWSELNRQYYIEKYSQALLSWIYHHTPYGAHPSHEARIKAAKDYLANQEDTNESQN